MTLSPSPNLTTYFGEGNIANYTNEEVVSIMNEVKNTTDEGILKEKYTRLAEIYKTDAPYISLYNNKYTVAYNSRFSRRNYTKLVLSILWNRKLVQINV